MATATAPSSPSISRARRDLCSVTYIQPGASGIGPPLTALGAIADVRAVFVVDLVTGAVATGPRPQAPIGLWLALPVSGNGL